MPYPTRRTFRGSHLELPAELQSLARLRQAAEDLESELTDEQRQDLVLVATELFTNAVRHAGVTSDDRIDVVLERRPGSVRVEVRDPGPGFVPSAQAPGSRQVSGRGMFLLDQLADRWGVAHEAGFTVWGEFWTASGRTRHRRLPPRMLAVGAERLGRSAALPEEATLDIPSPEGVRALPDAALKDLVNALAGEEEEVSARRRELHGQIDALRLELARRLAVEREDDLLQAADLEALARVLDQRMPSLADT